MKTRALFVAAIILFFRPTTILATDGSETAFLHAAELDGPGGGGDAGPPTMERVATGPMIHPRQEHTATRLADGKVLIVGWNSEASELYDPMTDSFSETGSTIYLHRQGLTATLLPNGKVLIAGGGGGRDPAHTVELYDPTTGLFTLTDSMNTVHAYHTATLLLDGRVLIAGGQDPIGPQTHAVSELYDPQTETFTLTNSLNGHRSGHTATLLPDGKVLITGGIQTTTPGSGIFLGTAEIYDPATESFTQTQSMNQVRVGHSATLLDDGTVLVAGGAWYSNLGEIYDPVQQEWVPTGVQLLPRRMYHTATLLPDGYVAITGGMAESVTASVELFDRATGSFTVADSMSTPRMQHCAVLLENGKVLITGGYDGEDATQSAELLAPQLATEVGSDHPVERNALAHSFSLAQNYPNPFNPTTTIVFEIAGSAGSKVRLSVYDALGREVALLVDEDMPPGRHEVSFDAARLVSAVYFYRLQSGLSAITRKMAVLK